MESVILGSPLLLILYGTALFICVFDIIKRATGYVFPLISVLLFVSASAYAILAGATYYELGGAALIFLCLNLISLIRRGGDKQ